MHFRNFAMWVGSMLLPQPMFCISVVVHLMSCNARVACCRLMSMSNLESLMWSLNSDCQKLFEYIASLILICSATIRPDPFAPYRILRTKVPGLRPGHDLAVYCKKLCITFQTCGYVKMCSKVESCMEIVSTTQRRQVFMNIGNPK